MTPTRRSIPWTSSNARTTFITTTGGIGLAFIAWWGSSGTGRLGRQVTWTVVAVIAVILIGVGNFAWLRAGRRAVALKGTNVVEMLEHAAASLVAARAPMSIDRTFVLLAGSERYHRKSCVLVRGKDVQRVRSRGRRLDGLRPCEMCEP